MANQIDPKKLPGTDSLLVDGAIVDVEATKIYGSDGSYTSEGKSSLLGIGNKLKYKGTWRLKGNEIIFLLQ